jgi:hypothetical protein
LLLLLRSHDLGSDPANLLIAFHIVGVIGVGKTALSDGLELPSPI